MNILAYLCSQHMKINNERVPIQRNYALILKKKTIPLTYVLNATKQMKS